MYSYTVDAYTAEKRWAISAYPTRELAIRYAMRRIRQRHGTVKVYNGDNLIWQRG